MATLNDIASITITTQTAGVSRAGFGTPMLAAYHTKFPETVRTYNSAIGVENDFGADHAVTRAAGVIFGQTPRPEQLKVGKRGSAHTQTIKYTPQTTTEGYKYSLTIGGEEATYTVQSGDAVADVVDGLVAAVNGLSVAVTATDNTSDFDVAVDSAGDLFKHEPDAQLDVSDNTSDPGIASDLTSIENADADWYGLALDSQSQAEVEAAASWLSSKDKIMLADNADTAIKDSGSTTDVAANLQSSNYDRTGLLYHHEIGGYLGPALLARMLTTDPGSETAAFQSLTGVSTTPRAFLTPTDVTNIEAKDCGYYQDVAGLALTFWGGMASGTYFDIIRGRDWLRARMQEDIVTLLSNNGKMPYTQKGANLVGDTIQGPLDLGAERGFVVGDSIVVTVPNVDNVASADKANRLLPDVEFSATLQGAIHNMDISGVLSV